MQNSDHEQTLLPFSQAFLLPALHVGDPSQLSALYEKEKFKGQKHAIGVI